MIYNEIQGKFLATEEKGEVSSLVIRPKDAKCLVVLGHGASSNMRHRTIETIAHRLADVSIATFRYHFPYMERGGKGRDARTVTLATVRSAVKAAHETVPDLPLFVGGHSFSGRMSSMAAAEHPLAKAHGIIFFAFPLHPAGKPAIERAEHLQKVKLPMLFLSGTRDKLAELDLLKPVCQKLKKFATLHLLDTADHSYKILKRSRKIEEDVFVEMARIACEWINGFIDQTPK